MRIIPVIDLLGGQVVRGIGGRRQEYRPIVSRLTSSTQPLDIARGFREHFGLNELYLADLDAIAGSPPAAATFAALREQGFECWVDAGVRNAIDARSLAELVSAVVVGLETIAGPDDIAQINQVLGNRVIFSLDLNDGKPLGNTAAWSTSEPRLIAERVIQMGVRSLIVLDLGRVGMSAGPSAVDLAAELVKEFPHVAIFVGGGIRGVDDIRRLAEIGVSGALVASALHDGKLPVHDLAMHNLEQSLIESQHRGTV